MAFAGFSNFITQLRDISVFDESTYRKATDNNTGPFKILIEPNSNRVGSNEPDVGVKGVIQAPISFSMTANWDVLGLENIFSSLTSQNAILKTVAGAAQTVMGAAGTSLTNSGLVTKKFYTKSDYLNFEVRFRVLDWDDDGMPVKTAQVMLGLCVPRKGPSDKVSNILKGIATEDSPVAKVVEKVQEGIQRIQQSDNEVLSTAGGALNRSAEEIGSGSINITQAPSPVRVKIGHWFEADDCVITNVNTQFAEQMTVAGPMYADFSVSLSTRETVTIGENGVEGLRIGAPKVGRVKIDTGGILNSTNI